MSEITTHAVQTAGHSVAYLFEAKGIQRWVLEGGRLRDIAAASNLLARTASSDNNDILQDVLNQSGFAPEFSRRAGGAFMLHFDGAVTEPTFARFRSLWRLVFMQIAPGLEFVEALGCGRTPIEARRNAYDSHGQMRFRAGRENTTASLLPLGHPFSLLAQRTGRPATKAIEYAGGEEGDRLDLVTDAKRRAGSGIGTLERKFCPHPGIAWPDQMEDDGNRKAILFPFEGDEQWIAVIHADVSALGQFYNAVGAAAGRLPDPAASLRMALDAARAIEDALTSAAQLATEKTMLELATREYSGVMPSRPVLLGGDDVTVIVRGDLALPFTKRFLEALEDVSQEKLTTFAAAHGLSGADAGEIEVRLTATAGVAFGKSKQPFFRLLDLAESLCGYAKKTAKARSNGQRASSLVAFQRVTESALAADADDFVARVKLEDGRRLTMQPYGVGKIPVAAPRLDDLEKLKQLLGEDGLKAGALRELRSLLLQELHDQAAEVLQRWRAMSAKRSGPLAKEFEARLLQACGGAVQPKSVFASQGVDAGGTPLFDAIEWRAIS